MSLCLLTFVGASPAQTSGEKQEQTARSGVPADAASSDPELSREVRAPLAARPQDSVPDVRWVALRVDAGINVGSLERLRADLEADLAPLGTRVIVESAGTSGLGHVPPPEVAAHVRFRRRSAQEITVEVDDYLTHKRLARDIDLGGVPADGHALTLALAADELLRASWAELDLKDQPAPAPRGAPATPTPAQPSAPSGKSRDPNHERSWFITAGPRLSTFSRGGTFWGGELAVGASRGPWTAQAQAFGNALLAETVPEGTITGDAWGGGLSVAYRLTAPGLFGLSPVLGLEALHTRLAGEPGASNQGATVSGLWLSAKLGLCLSFRWKRLVLTFDGGTGYALAAVIASVAGEPATGANGFEVWTGLHAGVSLP